MRAQRGFSMVEILVTMVILSVGLLGMAHLETLSAALNQSSYLKTQASMLAEDMIARMRSNRVAVEKKAYDKLPDPARVSGCLTTTGCSPEEMAQNDAFEWRLTLAGALPSGQGTVCIDSTPEDGASAAAPACDGLGDLQAVKIWWQDERDASKGLLRFSTSFQP